MPQPSSHWRCRLVSLAHSLYVKVSVLQGGTSLNMSALPMLSVCAPVAQLLHPRLLRWMLRLEHGMACKERHA